MARNWTEEEVAAVSEMRESGMAYAEIGKRVDRTAEQVRWKVRSLGSSPPKKSIKRPAPPDVPHGTGEGQPASVNESDLAMFRNSAVRPEVTGGYIGPDPESIWLDMEKKNSQKLEEHHLRNKFAIEFDRPRIAVCFISDQHISSGCTDLRKMREDAELIRDTPGLYCILAGDGVDNHIAIRQAMLAATSSPDTQYQLFEYYLQILGDKILCMCNGNHTQWTNSFAGIDMIGRIAQKNRIAYSPHGAYLDVTVKGHKYRFAVRHQYRYNSSFNQTHTVKQWLRMGDEDFDIGCIGHHHEASIEGFLWRGKRRWACRPGAYQITSSYTEQYGFNRAIPTCPTFVLYGDDREVSGFFDLHDAVDFLKV